MEFHSVSSMVVVAIGYSNVFIMVAVNANQASFLLILVRMGERVETFLLAVARVLSKNDSRWNRGPFHFEETRVQAASSREQMPRHDGKNEGQTRQG
jgi:hypothetical protein